MSKIKASIDLVSVEGLLPVHKCATCGGRGGQLSGILFIRALIPSRRDLPSWSNHFTKVPSPNTGALGIIISTWMGVCKYSAHYMQHTKQKGGSGEISRPSIGFHEKN